LRGGMHVAALVSMQRWQPWLILSLLVGPIGCADDLPASNGTGNDAAGASEGAGNQDAAPSSTPDQPGACQPLADIPQNDCPATWPGATAAAATFCAEEAGSLFGAFVSTDACRGLLRYTRHLFDGGPRFCLYDPGSHALVGYRLSDPKGFQFAVSCGPAESVQNDRDCLGVHCPPETPTLPACSRLSSQDVPDGGAERDGGVPACRSARRLLTCVNPDATQQICLSEAPDRCSDPPAGSGGAAACEDLCDQGEYAVACGTPGPGGVASPPPDCQARVPTPGGLVFACCPCAP